MDLYQEYVESFPIPETNYRSGTNGGTNGLNLTLPRSQHNSGVSFMYFNATTLIDSLATD